MNHLRFAIALTFGFTVLVFAACGAESGVFARTMCEQRARIAGCDGQWGEVALCPQSRIDERR